MFVLATAWISYLSIAAVNRAVLARNTGNDAGLYNQGCIFISLLGFACITSVLSYSTGETLSGLCLVALSISAVYSLHTWLTRDWKLAEMTQNIAPHDQLDPFKNLT